MQRKRRSDSLMSVGLFLLLCLITLTTESATVIEGGRRRRRIPPVDIPVGVMLDLNSSLGHMALNCTNIAFQDFYSTHASYSTKIQLHFNHSGNDLLTADSVALDLINNKKVRAILGPQNSEQARYVVELGYKYDVPVIWFSPSGPSLSPPRSRFFINSYSIGSHCFQFRAIAAIIEAYNWQSVIPIYEEPEFGNDLIPCLTYALQDMDTRMPYISPMSQSFKDDQITEELNKIKEKRTYVFIVHMTVELWSRLVEQAQKAGMMSEGYAWVLTQGLSSVMDPEAMDIKMKGFMDGALGVRPSLVVPYKTKLERVSLARSLLKYHKTLSLYGLWAYDTITALAKAVENASFVNSNERGVDLRKAITDTNFPGLSGNFSLSQGQLQPSKVVVYNVEDQRENIIGYWKPGRGLYQNDSVINGPPGTYQLRDPMWPGNTKERPPKLKIGVPKGLFTEFVNVTLDGKSTGFAIDVFNKVLEVLPFKLSYVFVPLNNTKGELTPFRYDDLLCNISSKELDVDVIIGDITIVVNRTGCVDFTMPYLDSSVSMVLKVRSDGKSRGILFKPFHWSLWLILGVIFVGATVIVFILERKKNRDDGESKFNRDDGESKFNRDEGESKFNRDDGESKFNRDEGESKFNRDEGESKFNRDDGESKFNRDEGESKFNRDDGENKFNSNDGESKFKRFVHNPFLIYLSDVGNLSDKTSKWVVIVVMFLLGVALQVYTANLTSFLNERTMAKPPPWKDVQEIKRNNKAVGYQSDSWVKHLLLQIGLKEEQLRPLGSRQDYMEALFKEDNDERRVDVIFDETPYLTLLLNECDSCKMTGPIYKAGGFGFAFPKNSTLVSNFSAAILNVTQNVAKFRDMKNKISLTVSIDKSEFKSDVETRGLTIEDFGGLFIIVLIVLVLFITFSVLKVTSFVVWLHNKFVSFLSPSGGVILIKR